MIGRVKSDRVPGWFLWCCSVIGGRLAGCSMVGLAETEEVLVCCIWRWIVDIHDSGMLIPLFSVLGWSCIWIVSFTWRVYQCRSWVMHWTPLQFGRWSASSMCYCRVVCPHKSRVSAVFQCYFSLWSACIPYVHLISTFARNPIHNSVMSIWNGGSFGWTK